MIRYPHIAVKHHAQAWKLTHETISCTRTHYALGAAAHTRTRHGLWYFRPSTLTNVLVMGSSHPAHFSQLASKHGYTHAHADRQTHPQPVTLHAAAANKPNAVELTTATTLRSVHDNTHTSKLFVLDPRPTTGSPDTRADHPSETLLRLRQF